VLFAMLSDIVLCWEIQKNDVGVYGRELVVLYK
jgi:hypothetical protein